MQGTTQATPRPRTLKMTLDHLIETYGLAELFDRMADLAYERSQITEQLRPDLSESWAEITKLMEQSVNHALDLPIK